jgi:hypothetical protein
MSCLLEIGDFFFLGNYGCVGVASFLDVPSPLRNFLTPELCLRAIEFPTTWFQQDGATVLAARALMEFVISLRGERPYPARSPGPSASDYFLWGYLKAKIYTTRPQTIDDLKIALRKQISDIPENMAGRALGNVRARLGEHVGLRIDG